MVTVEFVENIYHRWIQGEDIDMKKEILNGLTKPFENLHITVTNIGMFLMFARFNYQLTHVESTQERERIRELVEANGGRYSKNLTRHITHLISPIGGGRKVEGAIKWKQFLVDPEWFEDCLKRNARVNEKYYRLSLPKHKRGVGAFNGVPDPNASLLPPNYYSEERRVASQKVILARNKKNSDEVWASVIKSLPKARTEKAAPLNSVWDDSFIESRTEDVEVELEPESKVRKRNSSEIESESVTKRSRLNQNKEKPDQTFDLVKGIFEDQTFAFCGYERAQIRYLEGIIRSHNGRSSSDLLHPEVTHVIINSKTSPSEKAILTKGLSKRVAVATEWLIERSLFKKALVCDLWGSYIEHRSLPEFQGLNVSISGFSGVELLHIEKLIPMLGATFQSTFTAQRDVLIATPKSKKFQYALRWKVPIVRIEWLWECANTGKSVPLLSKWTLDSVDYGERTLHGSEYKPKALEKESNHTSKINANNNDGEKENLITLPRRSKHHSNETTRQNSKQNSLASETSQLVELLAGKLGASISQDGPSDSDTSPGKSRRFVGRARVSSTSSLTHASFQGENSRSSLNGATANQEVVGTQITYCDPDTLKDREALLNAMGTTSDYNPAYNFSQEMLPAEDSFPHRNLRKTSAGRK